MSGPTGRLPYRRVAVGPASLQPTPHFGVWDGDTAAIASKKEWNDSLRPRCICSVLGISSHEQTFLRRDSHSDHSCREHGQRGVQHTRMGDNPGPNEVQDRGVDRMTEEAIGTCGDHPTRCRIRARVEAASAKSQPRPEHEETCRDLHGNGAEAVCEESVPRLERHYGDDKQRRRIAPAQVPGGGLATVKHSASHGQLVVVRGDPLLCAPNVPMPHAFSPRERYQNPASGAGKVGSASVVLARLSKQTSLPPPGPTGNAPVLPRTTSN